MDETLLTSGNREPSPQLGTHNAEHHAGNSLSRADGCSPSALHHDSRKPWGGSVVIWVTRTQSTIKSRRRVATRHTQPRDSGCPKQVLAQEPIPPGHGSSLVMMQMRRRAYETARRLLGGPEGGLLVAPAYARWPDMTKTYPRGHRRQRAFAAWDRRPRAAERPKAATLPSALAS
ncbi:hypothetical protein C8034_v000469 [Colletotrichum sidae]|uniref:Uncharacterized protein n=1 Tax=Colletotrichum sidae TaxID=1347389 RepID=A0A4V3I341_9PEZI|nr:hypothetical protein C8034_v000469 [Colletotrichum sidae]